MTQQLHLCRVLNLVLDLPRLRLALRSACGWLSPLRFGSSVILETGMERDEDGVVLGFTGLPGSQRLHQ